MGNNNGEPTEIFDEIFIKNAVACKTNKLQNWNFKIMVTNI